MTGTISGVVTDPSGGVVNGTMVDRISVHDIQSSGCDIYIFIIPRPIIGGLAKNEGYGYGLEIALRQNQGDPLRVALSHQAALVELIGVELKGGAV
jgi:hypothetical protein